MTTITLAQHLEGWANQIAARFGHPVFLVGSAVEQGFEARDVDIVVVLPDDEFAGRYGDQHGFLHLVAEMWTDGDRRWARDMGKLASYAAKYLKVNVDLKVEPRMWALSERYAGKPRVRIDTVPDLDEVT